MSGNKIVLIRGGKMAMVTVILKNGEKKRGIHPFFRARYWRQSKPNAMYEKWIDTKEMKTFVNGEQMLTKFYKKNGGKDQVWSKWTREYKLSKMCNSGTQVMVSMC